MQTKLFMEHRLSMDLLSDIQMRKGVIMKTQAMHDQSRGTETAQEAVQRRAYELFVARGKKPGHELEDWLRAETEIRQGRQQNAHAQKS